MATRSAPWSRAMRKDDIDISKKSNWLKFNWRQNVSDGCERVGTISMPSAPTRPSRRGCTRSFSPPMYENVILAVSDAP